MDREHPSSPVRSPALPWEVIDKAINFCSGDATTLCSLALTCRQLHHRSTFILFSHVSLQTSDQVIQFECAIRARPDLQPLVKSLSHPWLSTSPFPLLSVLSGLRCLVFDLTPEESYIECDYAHSILRGASLRDLTLKRVHFASTTVFSRFLSAFPNIENLTIQEIHFSQTGDTSMPARLHLKTLNILRDVDERALRIIFEASQLMIDDQFQTGEPEREDRPVSITMWISLETNSDTVTSFEILRNLKQAAIRDISLVFAGSCVRSMYRCICRDNQSFLGLDDILLAYPTYQVSFIVDSPIHYRKTISWLDKISQSLQPLHLKWSFQDIHYTGKLGHDTHVSALVISTDGRWVATTAGDDTIILWDAHTGIISQEWIVDENVAALALSPDGQRLASASDHQQVIIWDISGNPVHKVETLESEFFYCFSLNWSNNGAFLALEYSSGGETAFKIWRVEGETLEELCLTGASFNIAEAYENAVFSPDSRWLLTRASFYGTRILDLGSLKHIDLLLDDDSEEDTEDAGDKNADEDQDKDKTDDSDEQDAKNRVDDEDEDEDEDDYFLSAAAFSHSGAHVAIAHTNRRVRMLKVKAQTAPVFCARSQYEVDQLAFSPDDQMLLLVSPEAMTIWDARMGTIIRSLSGHGGAVHKACFSPCGTYIASASEDKTIKVWRVDNGSCLATLSDHDAGVTHVVFTPDGTMLWSGARDGTVLARRVQDILSISPDPEV